MEEKKHPHSTKDSNTQSQGGNLTEYAFKFPIKNSFSNIEIPFAFQANLNENSKAGNFHSYIKIQETPTLFLDISNEENVDKLFLSSTIETLKTENKQHETKISSYEKNIANIKNENESLKEEISKLKEEFNLRGKAMANLTTKISQNEYNYEKCIKDYNSKLTNKNNMLNKVKNSVEHLEKIKNGTPNKDIINSAQKQFEIYLKEYTNSIDYLKAKFSGDSYSDTYIQKSLQLDLLDYEAYVKEQLKAIKPKIGDLIKLIQKAVNDSIGKEYEVKLYGSHATNLCLPWSDLDVVIVTRDEKPISNCHGLLAELYKHLKENDIFHIMNFISSTTIPLIKIQTEEEFKGISVDVSFQSNIHYGTKCVGLVTNFIKEYEVLVPMVLALKNILKKADLNNPYKVSNNSLNLLGRNQLLRDDSFGGLLSENAN